LARLVQRAFQGRASAQAALADAEADPADNTFTTADRVRALIGSVS
jgi:hypothetical protein